MIVTLEYELTFASVAAYLRNLDDGPHKLTAFRLLFARLTSETLDAARDFLTSTGRGPGDKDVQFLDLLADALTRYRALYSLEEDGS